jgi:hypothetical protein
MSEEIVELRDVSKRSDARIMALNGVTLSIPWGSHFRAPGPNGSGKTTCSRSSSASSSISRQCLRRPVSPAVPDDRWTDRLHASAQRSVRGSLGLREPRLLCCRKRPTGPKEADPGTRRDPRARRQDRLPHPRTVRRNETASFAGMRYGPRTELLSFDDYGQLDPRCAGNSGVISGSWRTAEKPSSSRPTPSTRRDTAILWDSSGRE